MRYIYADNSATTAISPTVLVKMMPVLTEYYGNPSSLYRIGGKAKEILENSRENIAKVKERHPEIMLNIIVKDYQNNILETHFSADNIELLLPLQYTREKLEELIND